MEVEAQRVCVFQEVQALGSGAGASCSDADVVAALQNIKNEELEELRKLSRPPTVVRRTLELMYLILDAARTPLQLASPDWTKIQKKMNAVGFLSDVLHYDVNLLRAAPSLTSFLVAEYFTQRSSVHRQMGMKTVHTEALTFNRVLRANQAAGALFKWCVAVISRVAVISHVESDLPQDVDDEDDAGCNLPTNDNSESDETLITASPQLHVQEDPVDESPEPIDESESRVEVIWLKMKSILKLWKAQATKPDRHFEGFFQFGVGRYSVSTEHMPLLQSFVIAMRSRPKLQMQLVTGKDSLEGNDVAAWRANNTRTFFEKIRIPCCIVDGKQAASITRPAGILGQLILKEDRDLRTFFHARSAAAKKVALDLSGYWLFPALAQGAACLLFGDDDDDLLNVAISSKGHFCAVLTMKKLVPMPEDVVLQLAGAADWLETQFSTYIHHL